MQGVQPFACSIQPTKTFRNVYPFPDKLCVMFIYCCLHKISFYHSLQFHLIFKFGFILPCVVLWSGGKKIKKIARRYKRYSIENYAKRKLGKVIDISSFKGLYIVFSQVSFHDEFGLLSFIWEMRPKSWVMMMMAIYYLI